MASQQYTGEDNQWRGWAAHDRRFTPANTDPASSYTQGGPRAGGVAVPGDDLSAGVVATSGDQDQALSLQVLRGGLPQLAGGAEFGYRLSTEATTELRGWELPNVIRGSYPIRYGTYAYSQPAILALRDGRLWAAFESDELGANTLEFEWLTPSQATVWTSGDNIPAVHVTGPVALAQDAQGRLFCLFCDTTTIAGYSEWQLWRTSLPDLATGYAWQKIASQPFGTGGPSTAATRLRLFCLPNGDLCVIAIRPTAVLGSVTQWASSDGGRTFAQVVSLANLTTNQSDAWQLPSGAVAVVLVDAAGVARIYATGSAWRAFNSSVGVSVTTTVTCAWGATDPNGRIYVFVRGATNQDRLWVQWSDDQGTSWITADHTAHSFNGDTAEQINGGQFAHLGGAMYLACASIDGTGTGDASPMVYALGGWSNMSVIGSFATFATEYSRLGSGTYYPIPGDWQIANWLPITEASNVGCWTATGLGTGQLVTPGVEEIVTVANTRYFEATPALSATQDTVIGEFQFQLLAGGGSLLNPAVGIVSRLSNGATGSELRIHLATGALCVRSSTAALATASIDVTNQPVQVRYVHVRESRIEVYYKRPTGSAWTLLYSSAPASIATALRFLRWGQSTASTNTSRWWYLWTKIASSASVATIPLYGSSASALANADRQLGRVVSGLPAAIDTLADGSAGQGLRQTYLRTIDGPFSTGEQFTSSPTYDYPIEAMYPTIQPSPRRVWRSADTNEQTIEWDLGAYGMQARAVSLALFNVNFQYAELETYEASVGTWTSRGTLDTSIDFQALRYNRQDGILTIGGPPTRARYVWRNELVGASVDLGGGLWRRIVRHSEGIWSTAAGKHVEIEIEGWDPSDPATGDAYISTRQAALIIPDESLNVEKWRIRIPAQSTAGGYFQIGTFVLGSLLIPGSTHGWGTVTTYERNAEDFASADLVSRAQRRGPVARTWSWAWPDGIDLSRLYDYPPTPDYLSTGGTDGVANLNDAPYFLAGMLEELRSGEIPICAFEFSGNKAETITDPTLFMLARIVSSIGLEHIQGRPEADAVYRISPLTMREIV